MSNYFEAPEADVEDDSAAAVAGWILWVSLSLVAVSTLIYLGIQVATPAYEDLFRGFGGDLPAVTEFALVAGRYALLVAVLTAIPLINLWRRRRSTEARVGRDFGLVIAGFVVAVFAAAGWVFAMYMPIYTMGSVV